MAEVNKLDLHEVFRDVLRQNIAVMIGKPVDVEVRLLPSRSLESLSDLDERGFFHNTFGSSDFIVFALFIPEAAFKTLRSIFAHVHGEAVDTISPARIGLWLDGNLSRLFYLTRDEAAVPEQSWKVNPFFYLPKSYKPDEKEETLWRFSGSTLYRIISGEVSFYLIVDTSVLARVAKLLVSDRFFQWTVRSEVMLHAVGGDTRFFDREKPIRINIEKNNEFLLGKFLIPLRPQFKALRGRTFYRAVVASNEGIIDTGVDTTRFRLSFNFADQVFEWYYSFYMTGVEEDRVCLKAVVGGAMNFLKEVMNIHGVRGNFLNPNIYPDLSDHVCVEADILLGKTTARCRVFVDSAFLTTLARLLLPPWETEYLKRNLFVRVLSVISLNQALFRKNIRGFYRESLRAVNHDAAEVRSTIRVAELLNLVPPEDERLIVQNFFLARGWTIPALQCLFFFERRQKADDPVQIFVDSVFDSARFLAVLPRAKRDEWNRSLAASLSWKELEERNLRAMLDLYEAVDEDRVVLSFRTRFLLNNEFKHRLDDDYAAAVAALADDRLYIDRLSEMPPSVAQGILSRFPLERLALALLVDSSDRLVLDTFISAKKRSLLNEEIGFRAQGHKNGTIKTRALFEAMKDLRETVEKGFMVWKEEAEGED